MRRREKDRLGHKSKKMAKRRKMAEAQKRLFAVAADEDASYEQFVQAYRRVVKIQEDAVKKENAKIMEANAKRFPHMPMMKGP
jgi:hypothetical protein